MRPEPFIFDERRRVDGERLNLVQVCWSKVFHVGELSTAEFEQMLHS